MFNIKINNKQIKARKGETILQAAQRNKINIPTLCYHSDLPAKASCRVCVVEIKGHKNPEPACSTKVKDGMEITTHSPALKQLRKINLEECDDCVYGFNCAFRKLAQEYGVEINRFRDRKTNFPVHQFGPALLFDSSKCIDCGNCIEVCKQQKVNYLIKEEKETFNQIAPNPASA